jgi:hypothetical protein
VGISQPNTPAPKQKSRHGEPVRLFDEAEKAD